VDNDNYKLVTRRWLAWGVGGLFSLTVCFTAVWSVIYGLDSYVTLAVGIAGVSIGAVLGYYFGKKTSEE